MRIIATNLGAGRLVAADRIRTIGRGCCNLIIARRTIGYADDVAHRAAFIAVKRTFGRITACLGSVPVTIGTTTRLVGLLLVTLRIHVRAFVHRIRCRMTGVISGNRTPRRIPLPFAIAQHRGTRHGLVRLAVKAVG